MDNSQTATPKRLGHLLLSTANLSLSRLIFKTNPAGLCRWDFFFAFRFNLIVLLKGFNRGEFSLLPLIDAPDPRPIVVSLARQEIAA
jgi:hypothetical protein